MTDLALTTAEAMPSTFIATTPAQMQVQQDAMIAWTDKRIEEEKHEISDLERTLSEAQRVGMALAGWRTRLRLARAKMTFYRKVKVALLKGYYIVPPFPVQLFAIRTERMGPRWQSSSYRQDFEAKPTRLAEGKGEWVSPFPKVEKVTRIATDATGKRTDDSYWRPERWLGVDFPFKVVKPEIITAVAGAMEGLLFDALGIAPQYRSADPIVIGQIIPPHRPHDPMCFFVAWWMDLEKL